MTEFERKLEQLRHLLAERQLDALVLNRVSSFAWATCGASSYVNTAASDGVGTLVITADRHYLVTNTIEAGRLEKEEGLGAQSWEFRVDPWYGPGQALPGLLAGRKAGADSSLPGLADLSVELARLRAGLGPEEGVRFGALGKLCAEAMGQVMSSIQPGQTERRIAARLAEETETRGVQPIAIMVATDERAFTYRHPLPKDKTLEKYAMVILCGRKWGLVCSITRSVHFGTLSGELRRKMEACAAVEAGFLHHTRPGKTLGQIFAEAQAAYAAAGFPDEWQKHHQGGSAGYEPREFVSVPGLAELVAAGQAYAWNPSIQGAKLEDTILIGETENEILTAMSGWPTLTVEVGGTTVQRPAIWEIPA